MRRRWRSIMHGRVQVYEQLESEDATLWRVIGTVVEQGDGTYMASCGGHRLEVGFQTPAEAMRIVEEQLQRLARPSEPGAATVRELEPLRELALV